MGHSTDLPLGSFILFGRFIPLYDHWSSLGGEVLERLTGLSFHSETLHVFVLHHLDEEDCCVSTF